MTVFRGDRQIMVTIMVALFLLPATVCPAQTRKRKPARPSEILRTQLAKYRSESEFYKNFPYGRYFDKISFTDFGQLQADRLQVWRTFRDGDKFLYHLGERFIRYYPLGKIASIEHLQKKVEIGKTYLRAKGRGINKNNITPYRIVGYFILGHVARHIEARIRQQTLDPSQVAVASLIDQLRENKVSVAIEKSTARKVIDNVIQGNLEYVAQRAKSKSVSYVEELRGSRRLGKTELIVAGGGLLLWILLCWKLSLLKYSWGKQFTIAIIFGAIVCVVVYIYILDPAGTIKPVAGQRIPKTSLAMKLAGNLHPQQSQPCMRIFDIKQHHTPIGHAIFLRRACAKADYFPQRAAQRFQHAQAKTLVMVATSGSFTNNYNEPEGLTVDRGEIVNAVILHDRHGLVLVKPSGGIMVIDLKRQSITLPTGQGAVEFPNPLRSLVRYSRLLQWCRDQKATLFQTQLLAYSNQLRIDPTKAPKKQRERRFLVLVEKPNELWHVIVNLPGAHALAEIAWEMFALFHEQGYSISSMMNLDTGAQDVLFVYDNRFREIRELRGKKDYNQTTNILLYRK